MEEENSTTVENTEDQREGSRERSTIQFPYIALPEVVTVAKAIFSKVGTGEIDDHQLAAALDMSEKSSGYRIRLSAGRLFGLAETVSAGTHKLTALGLKFSDPAQEEAAKVEAFLNVPLFEKVFGENKGRQLPPSEGFEQMLIQYGVAPKQKERARQVLEKSAQDAGFFSHGKGKLVRPTAKATSTPPAGNEPLPPSSGDAGGGGRKSLDPILQGLIDRLPPVGEVWPTEERKLWLGILENSFQLVYKDQVHQLPGLSAVSAAAPVVNDGDEGA